MPPQRSGSNPARFSQRALSASSARRDFRPTGSWAGPGSRKPPNLRMSGSSSLPLRKRPFAHGETCLNVPKLSDHGDNMAILDRFFGPDRDQIWEKLADEVGGNFYDGGFWLGESKVRAKVGDWIVTLNTYKDHRHVTYTLI